jgi:acyl carrier protein phosphodiesterase
LNYLAHFFLSGNSPDLLIGNFIADSVKGKQPDLYPEGIRKGILMHRSIDYFTDTHPVTARSKARLRARFNHYSGVITDVFYDHFLARDWKHYSAEPLSDYAGRIYDFLESQAENFPEKPRFMLPFMKKHNWLMAYSETEGIRHVLTGMSRRTKFESGMEDAADALIANYADFEMDFKEFFPDILAFTEDYRK